MIHDGETRGGVQSNAPYGAPGESRVPLVLLPGLDGTGRLFAPLIERLPAWLEPWVIGYPADRMLGYDQLVRYVSERLPDRPYVLLGESFSGPVAIRIATESAVPPLRLILAASFPRQPLPRFAARLLHPLVRPTLFRMFPFALIGRMLLGPKAPASLARELRAAIASVDHAVMAHRTRSVLRVDVRPALGGSTIPILYLAATHDPVVGKRGLREVLRCRPDAAIVRIDAPHLVLQREPEAAARAIERFLPPLLPGRP